MTDVSRALCSGAFDCTPLFELSDVAGVASLFKVRATNGSSGLHGGECGSAAVRAAPVQPEEFSLSSISSVEVATGTDERYDALRAAALSTRREDPVLDSISGLGNSVDVLRSLNLSGDDSVHTAESTSVETEPLGQDLRKRVEELLHGAQPTGLLSLKYTSAAVEDAFQQFERPFTRRAQTTMAVMNMVFVATIATAEGLDEGFDTRGGGIGACCVSFGLSLAWLAVLRSDRLGELCSRRSLAAVFTFLFVSLDYVALALFPTSIVNASLYYVQCTVLAILWAGSSSSLATSVLAIVFTGLNIVFGWALPASNAFVLLSLSTATLAVVIYASFVLESARRKHFEAVCVSNAHLRACEDELAMQRKMYEMLLPPFLATMMIERKLKCSIGFKSFARMFDQVVIVAIRIDGLTVLMSELLDDPQTALRVAETIFFRIEEVLRRAIVECCPAEYAPVSDELLCKISTLGDEIMLGGPLLRQQASDTVLSLSAAVAMRFIATFLGDADVLEPRGSEYAPRFQATIVAAFHSASLVLLESECLSLQLYGTGPSQAQALLRAAPRAFVGCTESFKALAERSGAHPGGCSIGSSELWRVRGVGSTMVSKITAQTLAPPHSVM